MPERIYTEAELEHTVKKRVDEFVQHRIIEQLQTRLDDANHIKQLIEMRLDKIEEQARVNAQIVASKNAFWQTVQGKAVTWIGLAAAVAVALHDTGVIK